MRAFLRLAPWIVVGMTAGLALETGQMVHADRGAVVSDELSDLPVEQLRTFAEVFGRIKRDYVEEVDDKELLEYAIEGMLSGLDPHSSYLKPESFKELQVGTSGQFGGLGIEVGMENGFVKVIAPIDDTPAARAGIQSGDLIIRLGDKPVKGMTLGDAVKLMRGKPKTDILLTVVREGVDKPLKITITRAIIKVQSVKSRILAPGFGYVRVSHFQSGSPAQMTKAVEQLAKDEGGELNGLILDLRNNPGGVLNAAVAISDAFLKNGLIVYTEGRVADSKLRFEASGEDIIDGAPIVVLVNAGSASASEIVAGALQDQKRGIVMGQPTFGKGSVQTIVPVQAGAAVKLTTARYYTPSGRSIQAEGIQPDIVLEKVKISTVDSSSFEPVKEANLSGHLDNGKEGDSEAEDQRTAEEIASGAGGEKAEKEKTLAEKDYQLYEALNLLKGLYLLQSRRGSA